MLDYDSLSNDEIREKLTSMGKKVGPINDSNRKVYIKMLSGKSPKSYSPSRRNKSPSSTSYNSISSSTTRRNKSPANSSFGSSASPTKRNRSPASSTTSYSSTRRNKSPVNLSFYNESSYSSYVAPTRRNISLTDSYNSDNFYSPSTTRNKSSVQNNYSEPPFVVPKKKKGTPGFVPPIVAGFLFFMALLIFYWSYQNKIHEGVTNAHSYFIQFILFCYTYGVIPIIAGALISVAVYAMYYLFNIHRIKTEKYQEELRNLIKDMLRSIRKSGNDGLPIRQLRDKMIPAYSRTQEQLKMWNEAEKFIKEQDTRVRTEERLINDADIAEFFVWSAPFSDDYE